MGDFNQDAKPDIVWSHTERPVRVLWYMDELDLLPGSGAVLGSNVPAVSQPGTDWEIQGVGDYNRDGKADLVWRQGEVGTTVIWNMDGAQAIGGSAVQPTVPTSFALAIN